MKSEQLLLSLINIVFFFAVVAAIFAGGLTILAFVTHDGVGILIDSSTGEVLDKHLEASPTIKDYVKVFLSIIMTFLFVVPIYFLRKATVDLVRGHMYSEQVVTGLRWAGITIIGYKVFEVLVTFYERLAFQGKMKLEVEFLSVDSLVFVVIIGLFFILLSKVVVHAAGLQKDVNMTI